MAGKKRNIKVFSEIELTFGEAMKDFMYEKRANGLSPSTIASYESNLKPFHSFVAEAGKSQVAKFTKDDFTAFRMWLQAPERSGWTKTTVNTYLRNTRVFLYYIMEQQKMERFSINLNPQEQLIKDTYSDLDIQKLIKQPDMKGIQFGEYRNWVMVNYLVETGNRLNTVINLKVEDVDLDGRMVRLTTMKNRKHQYIPIGSTMALILKKYISDCDLKRTSYLFPNQAGERMKPDSMKHAVARYNNERGVEMTSIHAFRHTFARNFILSGGDAFKLQQHLGHSSLAMTQQYVGLFGRDLQKGFEDRSLIERLTPKKMKVRKKIG